MKTEKNKLIGTWRLVSSIKALPDGRTYSVFAENPLGYFIFTKEFIASVQIMRRERDYNNRLLNDYLAYTGHYSIDDQEKIITIQVETGLSADYVGKQIKRGYQLENDRLELKVFESELDYRVTWERVY